jgi:polysaccharide biosynthesis protein PslH
VAVVPVLAGSGTRIKIIEAWAAGLPVVSTTIGAEGLPGMAGEHLLIADTAGEFLAAVEQVLSHSDLRQRLASNGRLLYEQQLTWAAAWNALEGAGL